MKQYVIDQLREDDHQQIQRYLDEHAEKSVFGEVYWVELPEKLHNPTQKEHTQCRPFYFAVSLEHDHVEFEFLIRSRQTLRCNCIGYASREQRDYIIGFADGMLDQLNIKL